MNTTTQMTIEQLIKSTAAAVARISEQLGIVRQRLQAAVEAVISATNALAAIGSDNERIEVREARYSLERCETDARAAKRLESKLNKLLLVESNNYSALLTLQPDAIAS